MTRQIGAAARQYQTWVVAFLRALGKPSVTVAVTATAVSAEWLFPLHHGIVVALLITNLASILIPIAVGLNHTPALECFAVAPYPPIALVFPSRGHLFVAFTVCVIGPLVGGLIRVIPAYIALYLASCAASALYLSVRAAGRSASASLTVAYARLSTNALAQWTLMHACYGILLVWPIVACRPMRYPPLAAHLISCVERTTNSADAPWPCGLLANGMCGNTRNISTRAEMTALAGNGLSAKCFLLSAEHLHFILLALLLTGSLTHTCVWRPSHRIRSAVVDLSSVVVAHVLFTACAWWEILSHRLPDIPWRQRGWSLFVLATLWLAIHWLISRLNAPEVSDNRDNLRARELGCMTHKTVFASLCVVAYGVMVLWHDPGKQKAGRIMIDEAHSQWEKADLPMETSFYGVKTVYNYSYLKEFLQKHSSSVTLNYDPITYDALKNVDVLILKTPTAPYGQAEVDTIERFVQSGGGLWLIGDHTNIFGINTYLNQVSGRWQLYLHADAVCPLHDLYQECVSIHNVKPYHECGHRKHETLFSRRYLNHPIIGHNIPYMAVLTSCTVSAPLWCEYVSVSRGTFVDHARFGGNTFFGNLEPDPDERYGCVLQDVALRTGKGRVAVWSDSTLFSNFAMCMSGVPQLALGYVNWLNRSNIIHPLVVRVLLLLIPCTLALSLAFRWIRLLDAIVGVCCGATVIALLVPFVDFVNSWHYAIDDYRAGYQTVCFDQQYSRLDLPNKDHVHQGRDSTVFESFYVLMQRAHLMPLSTDRLREGVTSDSLVIVDPRKAIEQSDVAALEGFLGRGGTLIVMLSGAREPRVAPTAAAASLNGLLTRLAIGARFNVLAKPKPLDLYGELIGPTVATDYAVGATVALSSSGGVVLMHASNGVPVIVFVPSRKGRVILCSVAELYNNVTLGEPGHVPSARQAVLLQSALRLANGLGGSINNDKLAAPWRQLVNASTIGE